MNKDQVQGRAKQVEGKLEAAAGKITDNKKMKKKGKLKEAVGEVQTRYGDLKEDLGKKN